jgi:hypothetical protein
MKTKRKTIWCILFIFSFILILLTLNRNRVDFEREKDIQFVYPVNTIPQRIDLVIAILTHPKNFEKRKSQRETWIRDIPPNFIYMFICGNPDQIAWDSPEERLRFDNEVLQFGDTLLFYEAIESYRGISKKVLLAIEHAVHLRSTIDNTPVLPRYIAKTDDDIYVAIKNVEELVQSPLPTPFYGGKIKTDHYAHREANSRWLTTYEEWPSDQIPYPDFACGAFYILSIDAAIAASKIFRNPDYKVFPYEDVQGGILMDQIGVKATSINVVETREPADDMIANHYGGIHTMWSFHDRFGKNQAIASN